MASPLFDMRVKNIFLDRPKVRRAVNRAKLRALSRAGAFIRQRARTSIRRRRGSSPPGSPPHSHEGSLRRLILFGYDRASDSVVVGPARLNKPGEAPSVLEFGGRTRVERRRTRRGGGRVIESKRVRIEARPYMGPALQKELPNIPKAWANSVRGG
ncbi:MAG: hypothetical protein EA376_01200 [Phycisphaeraceae bacterium]|nr:MAG: hypothetical protein EA376_01200 [Phycisphaeraceae bacterium]